MLINSYIKNSYVSIFNLFKIDLFQLYLLLQLKGSFTTHKPAFSSFKIGRVAKLPRPRLVLFCTAFSSKLSASSNPYLA